MKTTERSDERILSSDIFDVEIFGGERRRADRRDLGTVEEPARAVPVYRNCDVLVVGGGPSGTAAAVAAARTGADVVLLERYNHLGGLSTGGLVIWIDRMTDWSGQHVIRGFAEEIMGRLPPDAVAGPARAEWGSRDPARAAHWSHRTAAYHGVVTWSPTVDPERLKLASQELVLEEKVRLVFHSWAAMPLLENGKVRGAIFESKAGRQAVRAKVVVDATGDGDLFARAGAAYESDIEAADIHHCMNTAWLLGGVDMERWLEFKAGQPEQFTQFMARGREQLRAFERPFVSWRNDIALFMGPRQSGFSALDVDDQTEVEIRSHRLMAQHLDLLPCQRARIRERLPVLERAPARRAPCAPAVRRRQDAARALADRAGFRRRNRRNAQRVAEIPEHLDPLRQPGAGGAGRPARLRPAHRLRPELARLHARNPAVLDHRAGRRPGGRAGGKPRHRAARGRPERTAVGARRPGRVPPPARGEKNRNRLN